MTMAMTRAARATARPTTPAITIQGAVLGRRLFAGGDEAVSMAIGPLGEVVGGFAAGDPLIIAWGPLVRTESPLAAGMGAEVAFGVGFTTGMAPDLETEPPLTAELAPLLETEGKAPLLVTTGLAPEVDLRSPEAESSGLATGRGLEPGFFTTLPETTLLESRRTESPFLVSMRALS